MENEALYDRSDDVLVIFDEEEQELQNVFAKGKHTFRPRTSRQHRKHED
jgi:uncharacterized phage-like protein YoqJ